MNEDSKMMKGGDVATLHVLKSRVVYLLQFYQSEPLSQGNISIVFFFLQGKGRPKGRLGKATL